MLSIRRAVHTAHQCIVNSSLAFTLLESSDGPHEYAQFGYMGWASLLEKVGPLVPTQIPRSLYSISIRVRRIASIRLRKKHVFHCLCVIK